MTPFREAIIWRTTAEPALARSGEVCSLTAAESGEQAASEQVEVEKKEAVGATTEARTTTPTPSDDTLVAAVTAGDEAAFALLFERYRRLVTKIARSFFVRREQVEEIVQESFAKAYFALHSYRGGRDKSFPAWLSRITVSTCHDALRRARRAEGLLSDTCVSEEEAQLLTARLRDESVGSNIEAAAVSRDLAAKLLARLEPDDRVALALLDIAEYSVAEVAEMTGWSVPKVKMRAFRARAALRKALSRFL